MNFLTLLCVVLSMNEDKKAKRKRRDLIELGVILAIFATIYLTGSQAEVFGKVQQAVLVTGVMNANSLDEEDYVDANYDFKLVDVDGKILDAQRTKRQSHFHEYLGYLVCPLRGRNVLISISFMETLETIRTLSF